MNIAHILPNEKKEISNFFYDVFFQSEGKQEGLTLQELTLQLTEQIQNPLILGIKAHSNNEILGGLFLTQLQFQEGIRASLLAPVGVHPNHQGKKIGTQLIEYAVQYIKSQETPFLMTYGDPKYYSRFGFQWVSTQSIPLPILSRSLRVGS
jgi:putative acetyltransferase